MGDHTNLHVADRDGQQVSLSRTFIDAPTLPATNIKQLQEIDPKLVDWVIQQTEIESNFRRKDPKPLKSEIEIKDSFCFIQLNFDGLFIALPND